MGELCCNLGDLQAALLRGFIRDRVVVDTAVAVVMMARKQL